MSVQFSKPSFTNDSYDNDPNPNHNENKSNENQKNFNFHYKSFFVRLLAYLIDLSILFFLNSLIYLITDGSPIEPSEALFTAFNRLAYIHSSYGFLIFLLYNAGFEASPFQATPGKALLQLKVTGLDNRPVSFWKSILRNLLKPLSILLLFMGYFMILFTKKSQALHDIITKSIVSKAAIPGLKRQKASAIIWAVSGLLFALLVVLPAFYNIATPFKSALQDVKVNDIFFKLPNDWQYFVETYEADEFKIVCKPLDYSIKKVLTVRGYDLMYDEGLSNQEVAELLYNIIHEMSASYELNDIKNIKLNKTSSFGIRPASSVFFTEITQIDNIIHQTSIFTMAEKRIMFEYESPSSDEDYSIIGIIENTLEYKDQRR